LSLHGNHFVVAGPAVSVGERAQLAATANAVLRNGRGAGPPVLRAAGAQVSLKRNVFTGFGNEIVKGATVPERQEIAASNAILTTDSPR
jgi:hypothetical protein